MSTSAAECYREVEYQSTLISMQPPRVLAPSLHPIAKSLLSVQRLSLSRCRTAYARAARALASLMS